MPLHLFQRTQLISSHPSKATEGKKQATAGKKFKELPPPEQAPYVALHQKQVENKELYLLHRAGMLSVWRKEKKGKGEARLALLQRRGDIPALARPFGREGPKMAHVRDAIRRAIREARVEGHGTMAVFQHGVKAGEKAKQEWGEEMRQATQDANAVKATVEGAVAWMCTRVEEGKVWMEPTGLIPRLERGEETATPIIAGVIPLGRLSVYLHP